MKSPNNSSPKRSDHRKSTVNDRWAGKRWFTISHIADSQKLLIRFFHQSHNTVLFRGLFKLKQWIISSLKHDTVPRVNKLYCFYVKNPQNVLHYGIVKTVRHSPFFSWVVSSKEPNIALHRWRELCRETDLFNTLFTCFNTVYAVSPVKAQNALLY